MTKKFLLPFILASLAGHLLVLALTIRVDWAASPQSEKVISVELTTAPEKRTLPKAARQEKKQAISVTGGGGVREDSVALHGEASRYGSYLLMIRRKIEKLWNYPPQALSEQTEGNVVVTFTIDADGVLSGYHVITTSGSQILDEGALAVVRAASPYAPFPLDFRLSRLHITATFSYRMNP
jgi:TonB family protein